MRQLLTKVMTVFLLKSQLKGMKNQQGPHLRMPL